MSRAKWKGYYITKSVLKKKKKNFFKIFARKSTIPSTLLGKTVRVHNGKIFNKLLITRDKVGYKFGEFSLTRVYFKKKIENSIKKKIKK